jgi:hypothetical protein
VGKIKMACAIEEVRNEEIELKNENGICHRGS